MGAVTSIMYVAKDPTIAGMVLDSPFSSLKLLVSELVSDKVSLPEFIINQALKLVKSTVRKMAKFELDDIEPIKFVEACYIPCLFVHAKGDDFVKPHHSKRLYDVYPGDKNLINIEGDHNSFRPKFFKDSAGIFFYNTLQCESLPKISRRPSNGDAGGVASFFPNIQDERIAQTSQAGGIQMRPPDRAAPQWNQDQNDELSMQHAIEESLRHFASEETPDTTVRRQKT